MKNFIHDLEIQNFKTIKQVKLKCKRINLFIGKPNVGKSNLLEALSLLGSIYSFNQDRFLADFIRYKKFDDLFYDTITTNDIHLKSDIGSVLIRYFVHSRTFDYTLAPDKETFDYVLKQNDANAISNFIKNKLPKFVDNTSIKPFYCNLNHEGYAHRKSEDLILWHSPVKKYQFELLKEYTNNFHMFLLPPKGENLYAVIKSSPTFQKEVGSLFKDYKRKLSLHATKNEILLLKQSGNFTVTYDYYGIADTLQRYIFHYLAINSNTNSILLFEEPEAHSFPPYIQKIAMEIKNSKANQFFITTHSPFLLNNIVERTPKEEVAVFKVSYEKHQTKVEEMPEKEMEEYLNYGTDIFFHLK